MSKYKYDTITEEEYDEINDLVNKAIEKLGFENLENYREILEKLKEYILNNSNSKIDQTSNAYEFGSLFGKLIEIKYKWSWFIIERESTEYFCITSPNKRACCPVHSYFLSLLNGEKDLNFILLYNMIKKEYPKEWDFMFLV